MLNYKHSLHYSIFSFIYMLLANAAIQASGPAPPYKGDFIVKSELSTKVSTGINNYEELLKNHISDMKNEENTTNIGHVAFSFDGKEILEEKPKTNANIYESNMMMVSHYHIKNIEALIKGEKGDDFNIETQPVSKKEFTNILRKVLNVDKLEKKTGLQASLKLLNTSNMLNVHPSKSFLNCPVIQTSNIFKFVKYKNLDSTQIKDVAKKYSLSQLVITRRYEDLDLLSEMVVLIDLKDPSKDNDKNSNTNNNSNGNQELVKRILIGMAIVSPFLLLMGVFFYKKRTTKKKNELTTSPKYNTSVSPSTKETTTETTQKRTRRQDKAR